MATAGRTVTTVLAVGASAVALAGVQTAGTAVAAPPAGGVPTNVHLVATKHSLLGVHRWYAQTYHDLPVVGGYYVRHLTRYGRITAVVDGRQPVSESLSTKPTVGKRSADAAAERRVADAARRRSGRSDKNRVVAPSASDQSASLAVFGGRSPHLVWRVLTRGPQGVARTLVDAHTGKAVRTTVLTRNVKGRGRVFNPNPVVTLGDESLKDHKDKNQAVLWPAYQNVRIRHLDGSGKLSGQYVRIVRAKGGLAKSSSESFVYLRKNDRFEQVMAYYQLDQAQAYIQQLGFSDLNNEPQDVATDTFAGDNSFYDPTSDLITYGRGGVDDAEDAEVIWHEYGHAMQDDEVPGFGQSEQAGAIGEGFGDYWAVTMSVPVSHGFDLPCVMDWDSTSYTTTVPHCLRRTDTAKTSDDMTGEVHADGEIWSGALWDIQQAIGRRKADRTILESQYYYIPDTSFAGAARDVVATARALYGKRTAKACTSAFHRRKIL